MSWLEKLYETYESCSHFIGYDNNSTAPLLPICHTTNQAQIEIVIDETGSFIRAQVISKNDSVTIIPCTEESGGRTGSKPINHPLCDKLQYVAGDFIKFGGEVTSGYSKNPDEPHNLYLSLLNKWCASPYKHEKIAAVKKYVAKRSVISDLCACGILYLDLDTPKKLLNLWDTQRGEPPAIFKLMKKIPPEDSFIRWIVEIPGDNSSALHNDKSVWQSWSDYYIETKSNEDLCYVTGKNLILAKQHPAKLWPAVDKAKLISSNDSSGFTFRGRFTDHEGTQVCGVGFEVSQKAHNTLRWLISRQGYRNGDQAIVAWSVVGKKLPDLFADTSRLLLDDELNENNHSNPIENASVFHFNAAQNYALRLMRKIMGYKTDLGNSTGIVILALNAPTTGRVSITFYRELQSSEFLERIEAWHNDCCWLQDYGKELQFIGAPSPKDIAEVAYGKTASGENVRNSMIRQLLPCIIDTAPLPKQLVENCIRRASNKEGISKLDWEKALGIACALYRKQTKNERNYQMALETNRTTRDYLYGRLLAIAEKLEEVALGLTNEKRATNAERLMQRFADQPYSTWLIIEKALKPYEMKLRNQRAAFLCKIKGLMDEVMVVFNIEDFTSSAKLSGEFLIGYHCQRSALKFKKDESEESRQENIESNQLQENV